MNKLPISLVTVVRNSKEALGKLIERHRDLVAEIIVVDQDSTDGTYELALKEADLAVQRRKKGFPEPDRNFSVSLARCPFVLVLDDDESLSPDVWEKIAEAIETDADAFWLKRDNLVDGVNISNILGDDLQLRLWKKGAVRCSPVMHQYPEIAANAKVMYLDVAITHERTLEGLKRSNLSRNAVADPSVQRMQTEFIRVVEAELAKAKHAKG